MYYQENLPDTPKYISSPDSESGVTHSNSQDGLTRAPCGALPSPACFHLVQHGKRPDIPLYGEQVASPDALAWLDLVQADMEAAHHSVRTFDLCAAGFGAPIIRQRLFWLACACGNGCDRADGLTSEHGRERENGGISIRSQSPSWMECSVQPGLEGLSGKGNGQTGRQDPLGSITETGELSGMGGTCGESIQRNTGELSKTQKGIDSSREFNGDFPNGFELAGTSMVTGTGATNGFWRDADWLYCRDDKWRPVEPGTFPLADGYPYRVGILRGAGNAINAEVAKAFIQVTM